MLDMPDPSLEMRCYAEGGPITRLINPELEKTEYSLRDDIYYYILRLMNYYKCSSVLLYYYPLPNTERAQKVLTIGFLQYTGKKEKYLNLKRTGYMILFPNIKTQRFTEIKRVYKMNLYYNIEKLVAINHELYKPGGYEYLKLLEKYKL